MILVKTAKEVEAMKPACQISAEALRLGGEAVKPGVTTAQIDKIIYDYIVSQGARPNFKGLGGFPGSACISVNDVVIHGIPSHGIVLHEGDIVSIDTGAAVHGWNGDNAATFACGEVSETAQRLMDVTKDFLLVMFSSHFMISNSKSCSSSCAKVFEPDIPLLTLLYIQ